MIKNNNNNILPYFIKDLSTLIAISVIALLLTSTLLLSNPFLQPVQAQTRMTFKTPEGEPAIDSADSLALTFDIQGTLSSSNPQQVDITTGTIQLQETPHGQNYTGEINRATFTNTTSGVEIDFDATIDNTDYEGYSACNTSENNVISLSNANGETDFLGVVECSSQGGGGNATTAQPASSSSMTAGSSQDTDRGGSGSGSTSSSNSKDSDGDAIPDSSDRCTHNSNPRCFKEGDTSTAATTTSTSTNHQQEQPSSNRTGNQTR